MNRQTLLISLLALLVIWSVAPGFAQSQTPSAVGQWNLGPVWDIAPVHMVMLPNGKVMLWPGDYVNGDDARLWDPADNSLISLAKAGYDLFCSGHISIADGTIFVPGGNLLTPFNGLPYASIYNPVTNVWTRLPDMNAARWYPTTTFTGTGEVLVMTGTIDSTQEENPLPQVWQPSTGTWRDLTNALLKIYFYSWVYWTQFGNAVVVGPGGNTRYLDISGTGAWTFVATFNYPETRAQGSSVMYDPTGKILIAGGAGQNGDHPPTNTAEIIDLSAPTPTWQYTNPMAFPRRQFNLTMLPDDNVLVTGGSSGTGFNDTTSPVYPAEMWNPSTKTWTTMASQTVGRFYHSNAMLLPDGRVLSTGGNFTYQTEFYSPPYLFKGARPTITSVPATISYGQTFFVGTPDATSIAKVRLIRLPGVTHTFDQNQRILPISFTQAAGGLNLTAPPNSNMAPAGYYMLFILNGNGVPSVAKILQVGGQGGGGGGDADGDGVPDSTDQCPTVAGPAPTGCPAGGVGDIDGDGVPDSTDQCPAVAGPAPTGCPAGGGGGGGDIDGDGVPDSTDQCPAVAGPAPTGCPAGGGGDMDGDGVPDSTDQCPTVAGPAPTGCPLSGAPAAPSSLIGNVVSSSQINLIWSDGSNNESGFKIERQTGTGSFTQIATVGANVTTYSNTGLTPATSYTYRVRATNSAGDSAFSNTASATTSAATSNLIDMSKVTSAGGFGYWAAQNFGTPADTTSAPTRSILRIFENGIELGPAHSSHTNVRNLGTGRFSHWDDGSGTAGAVALLFSASDNTNPKTNGRTYTYQVGSSASPPAAPTGLGATAASSAAINLTWVDQSTNETGFKIERALGAGAFSQVATVGADVTTYADSGLTASTSYSYRVRATNSAGDSTYSNTATAMTSAAPPSPPAAPTGLVATAASSSAINLTWLDQSTNETGFKIERALGAGAFSQVATVGAGVTTYADSGLTASTSYSYRVRATNSAGNSVYSNTASCDDERCDVESY